MGKRNGTQHSVPRSTLADTSPRAAAPPVRSVSAALSTVRFLYRLILFLTQRYPFVFWTGALAVMVLMSWTAIQGILYTNDEPLVVEQPQSEVGVPAQMSQLFPSSDPAASFGLLAGIVLCCGMSCVLLARQLRPVKPSPQRRMGASRSAKADISSKSAAPAKAQLQRSSATPTVNAGAKPMPKVPAKPVTAGARPGKPMGVPKPAAAPNGQRSGRSGPRPAVPAAAPAATARSAKADTSSRSPHPAVSVVPAEEAHALDWGEPGLADLMDIRKRNSVSPY